ncbi:zinc finger MYM-type protein 1-like [Lolium rigidum]|uniref:zinc finger MYM-type protein 1-like n=1 Tax=Lolium rigidum TaxID=89674 RepID=UPI001F5CC5DD|nr:zinc finger MYM-type protein 1-like [Lolium rigidum]
MGKDSGAAKRNKKRRLEAMALSQRGALDRFIVRESQVNSENQASDDNIDDDTVEVDAPFADANIVDDAVIGDQSVHPNIDDDPNIGNEGNDTNVADDINNSYHPDIFDPRTWDGLDKKMIDILVQKGPKRDLSIEHGPKDNVSRRFSAVSYNRVLSNGEKFSERLREHETSREHVTNMTSWYDLRLRFDKNQTIDKVAQRELEKEKEHWRKVLFRILLIVKFLAEHNLAFRGSNSKVYQDNNGNFLGLVEMLAEFDPVIKEHIDRITNDKIRDHYLGPSIQNELIILLADAIRSVIIGKIKEAKYFSVILDCTPDASHQEQMSLIIRYVDTSSGSACIQESFLGFLDVNDTTGQGLFDVLQEALKSLDLDVGNVRGQGYDNGSNMKGKHQGVQKKLLNINPRAFYSACGCHSLNLTLCDMANSCRKATDFFGVIQRIYTTFANSTKRWQILKDNISGLTLKSLSSTRWESRVDSVKAVRFQISDVREALLQVAESDKDHLTSSQAQSLAEHELGDFEFVSSLVIWFEILSNINMVSKELQSKDMLIDVAIESVQGLITFFSKYRETGFSKALQAAKQIAMEMDIPPEFRTKRKIKRKRQFDDSADDTSADIQSAEELFRVNYFIPIVDQAIASLKRRFEQYQGYEKTFGFLFTSDRLKSMDNDSLMAACINLENALKIPERIDADGNKIPEHKDIDGTELAMELVYFQDLLAKSMGPIDILSYLTKRPYLPVANIAYRILLTIPVTVASAERSFSKLKLLKSYLRTTMTQERLNGLATIALENDILEMINYEDVIEDFISRNTRRMMLFGRT